MASTQDSSVLLECGCIDVGTIHGDIVLREPHEANEERQRYFLRRADQNARRLWFLWNKDFSCGCCGGCQFLDGAIQRSEDFSSSEQYSRYFSISSDQQSISPRPQLHSGEFFAFPTSMSFNSLSSIEHLHKLLAQYHCFASVSPPYFSPPTSNMPLSKSTDVMSTLQRAADIISSQDDALSQDSDTYMSAKDSLSDDENFKSITNSPQASVKHSKHHRNRSDATVLDMPSVGPSPYISSARQRSKNLHATTSKINPELTRMYQPVLDTYKCQYNTLKVLSNHQATPTADSVSMGRPFNVATEASTQSKGSSPWKQAKQRGDVSTRLHTPKFVLSVPQISYSGVGMIPCVVPKTLPAKRASGVRFSHYQGEEERGGDKEEALATVSVSVNIVGNVGILVSPPFLSVVER